MPSDIVIDARGLGKKYTLSHRSQRAEGLRHLLQNAIHAPFRKIWGLPSDRLTIKTDTSSSKEAFWALRDVSFKILRGQVTGIIGRNGAGKSTLLKIMSRITDPTTGRVEIKGRVASLLEVGTGFQPELTGRENIFLNGAILGMRREEIRRKFDTIVDFAEIEKFLDTPVKFYSSGMYVRLAFAVAAHLEPEILIVDEVLAVGDTAFQQKCLEKIGAMSKTGRTVFFVSHNLSTVKQLCDQGILLHKGQIEFQGTASDAIAKYVQKQVATAGRWQSSGQGRSNKPCIYFLSAEFLNGKGESTPDFQNNELLALEIAFEATAPFENALIAVRFTNQEGIAAFTTCNTDRGQSFIPLETGLHKYRIELQTINLTPGRYTLKISAHIPQGYQLDLIDDELSFTVHDIGGHANLFKDNRLGVVCPVLDWKRI